MAAMKNGDEETGMPREEGKEAAPVLQISNLRRTFGGGAVVAVEDISLDVRPGEILSILGPSGCGKTTAMRMIAGLDDPDSGDIRIRGESVLGLPAHRRHVGMVFQSLAVFPHMSVYRNVAFGLRMQKVPKSEHRARIHRILELVQLDPAEFAGRMPSEMSGGQLQRVALARTLVTEPSLVLFDEPMAALDRRLRDYMAIELRTIQKNLGIAAIYVTHDQETASMMSDRIAIMQAGRFVQLGSPAEIYERPSNSFVADFLGDVNSLRARSLERHGRQLKIERKGRSFFAEAEKVAPDSPVSLLIRPEHISLASAPGANCFASGEVVAEHFVSGVFRLKIALEDGEEITVKTQDSAAAGGQVFLEAEPRFIRVSRD